MKSLLLDIIPLSGSHTGENLCQAFVQTCDDFGLLTKLLAITTDNASNNETLVSHLITVSQERSIQFRGSAVHVRCTAHIINLAVQAFLKGMGAEALDDEDAYANQRDIKKQPFVGRLRQLLVKIRGSPQRRERFARHCEVSELVPKQLIIDVRTRWNSTYDMVDRALELREPLQNMAMVDPDLQRYSLNDGEWQRLLNMRKILHIFKIATNHLTASSHPTLAIAVPIYNYVLDKLEDYSDSSNKGNFFGSAIEAAIDKLKSYYINTDIISVQRRKSLAIIFS